MPKSFSLGAALALAGLAAPALAEPVITPFEKVAHWDVERIVDGDTRYCNMSADFEGTTVMVSWVAAKKFSALSFEDEKPTALKEGDKTNFDIALLDAADKLDRGWGTSEFSVYELEGGNRQFVAILGPEFIDDLAKTKYLAFLVKDKVYASFQVDSLAAPVASLKRCSAAALAGK